MSVLAVKSAPIKEKVITEGAEIYCERRGDGPLLLLITGGMGDAGFYSSAAEILADEFTVLNYDRRCNSRSTGDRIFTICEAHVQVPVGSVTFFLNYKCAYIVVAYYLSKISEVDSSTIDCVDTHTLCGRLQEGLSDLLRRDDFSDNP